MILSPAASPRLLRSGGTSSDRTPKPLLRPNLRKEKAASRSNAVFQSWGKEAVDRELLRSVFPF
jgi:hypothetical protein